eukprot:5977709-Pleurochrysis_carterae.AAC.1
MMYHAVATVPQMLLLIRKILHTYVIVEVDELHALWDFSGWLRPHMYELRGYATSQFGDGMHEFILRKDNARVVSLHLRKSSQAS